MSGITAGIALATAAGGTNRKHQVSGGLCGNLGIGPWQQLELEAFLREFVNRQCPVIPVILPGAPQKPRLPDFLRLLLGWISVKTNPIL